MSHGDMTDYGHATIVRVLFRMISPPLNNRLFIVLNIVYRGLCCLSHERAAATFVMVMTLSFLFWPTKYPYIPL